MRSYWLVVTLLKDVSINLLAVVCAGYGATQLLLTAAVVLVFAFFTLTKRPFKDKSNIILETWTHLSVAVICIYSAGMGFASEPGLADTTDIAASSFYYSSR